MNIVANTVGLVSLSVTGAALAISPVQSGDLMIGLNRGTASETLQQVRGGALEGNYTALPWIQSVEFDNAAGPFSHSGNLLGLNFGTTSAGGQLYNIATNGSDAGEIIYEFNTALGGVETTRVSGLSVSPDNSRIAVFGSDTGSLLILDYSADNGDGSGASITGDDVFPFIAFSGTTQGTTWRDDNTVLMFTVNAPNRELISVNANTGALTVRATIAGGDVPFTSNFLDVEYNPSVEPDYIYLLASGFDGVSWNQLTALDATTYAVVNQVTLHNSLNTGREIALGPDGLLYLGAYGGSDAPGPVIDTISANPLTWTNDGSTDYYQAVGISSSFNGLDVALGGSAPAPDLTVNGTCPGQMELVASNVTPGAQVAFLYAFGTGNFTIPGGFTCAGTQLGLNNTVTLAGARNANGQGVATFTGNVPSGACGRVFVQAVDTSNCTTTDVEGL